MLVSAWCFSLGSLRESFFKILPTRLQPETPGYNLSEFVSMHPQPKSHIRRVQISLEKLCSESSALTVLSRIEIQILQRFFLYKVYLKLTSEINIFTGKKAENSKPLCAAFVDGALFLYYWLEHDLNLIIELNVHFVFVKQLLRMAVLMLIFRILNKLGQILFKPLLESNRDKTLQMEDSKWEKN